MTPAGDRTRTSIKIGTILRIFIDNTSHLIQDLPSRRLGLRRRERPCAHNLLRI